MKTPFILLWLFSLLFNVNKGLAQDTFTPHEISLGYGRGSNFEIVTSLLDLLGTSLSNRDVSIRNSDYSGAISGSYKYVFDNHFALGATYIYERNTSVTYKNNEKDGSYTQNYHVLAAEADYRYVHNDFFSMYSGLGIGISLYNSKYERVANSTLFDKATLMDFRVALLGFSFGKRIGGFSELGYGYKGILCMGVYGRL